MGVQASPGGDDAAWAARSICAVSRAAIPGRATTEPDTSNHSNRNLSWSWVDGFMLWLTAAFSVRSCLTARLSRRVVPRLWE